MTINIYLLLLFNSSAHFFLPSIGLIEFFFISTILTGKNFKMRQMYSKYDISKCLPAGMQQNYLKCHNLYLCLKLVALFAFRKSVLSHFKYLSNF